MRLELAAFGVGVWRLGTEKSCIVGLKKRKIPWEYTQWDEATAPGGVDSHNKRCILSTSF